MRTLHLSHSLMVCKTLHEIKTTIFIFLFSFFFYEEFPFLSGDSNISYHLVFTAILSTLFMSALVTGLAEICILTSDAVNRENIDEDKNYSITYFRNMMQPRIVYTYEQCYFRTDFIFLLSKYYV